MVELAERLIGKGFQVRIYDANVALSRLVGANRAYIDERCPTSAELLTDDIAEVLEHGEMFVVGIDRPGGRGGASSSSTRPRRCSIWCACRPTRCAAASATRDIRCIALVTCVHRFSFLTTAYRTEQYLPETIESVLAQTRSRTGS